MSNKCTPPLSLVSDADAAEHLTLAINDISVDPSINPRFQLNKVEIARMAYRLDSHLALPPLTVFVEGSTYILSDGFHRLQAHREHGSRTVEVVVHSGSRHDATIYAISVNANHGLPLTWAEKRAAVWKILDNADWATRSNREIAEICGCSPPTVAKVRLAHPLTKKVLGDKIRQVRGKNGRRRTMRVESLGKGRGKKVREAQAVQKSERCKAKANTVAQRDGSAAVATTTLAFKPRRDGQRLVAALESAIEGLPPPRALAASLMEADDAELIDRLGVALRWLGRLATTLERKQRPIKASRKGARDEW